MTSDPESDGPGPGEGLGAGDRLRRRADFLRCYRKGRRRSGRYLRLHFDPSPEGRPRVGTTISRKVGNSVVRHRVKRRLREIYRRWPRRSELPPLDIVIHVHPNAATASHAELASDLERLLAELVVGGR